MVPSQEAETMRRLSCEKEHELIGFVWPRRRLTCGHRRQCKHTHTHTHTYTHKQVARTVLALYGRAEYRRLRASGGQVAHKSAQLRHRDEQRVQKLFRAHAVVALRGQVREHAGGSEEMRAL